MICLSRRAALAAGSALTLISLCSAAAAADAAAPNTATPIKHLVVVFPGERLLRPHFVARKCKAPGVAGGPEFNDRRQHARAISGCAG